MHHPSADARAGVTRPDPLEEPPHHPARQRAGPAPRPGRAPVPRRHAEPAVGRRYHLCAHLRRLGLRLLRPRRVLPPHRGLAGLHQLAHRSGPRRPRDGPVDPGPRRTRHQPARPPLRQRNPIRGHPLHRTARRGRSSRLGRLPRRLLRQTPWPRPSTPCSRANSSAIAAPGARSTTSRSRWSNGSTGTTIGASTERSA